MSDLRARQHLMDPEFSGPTSPGQDGVVRLLRDDVINQIAAGEVIERPASVVKELMDNAIDAGATSIVVECDGGGRSRIRVVDDGIGMSPGDAQRCFARHATSKIRAVDDLFELATMGFRGEAMSSIASVARTVLTTRRVADLAATRVIVEHGRIISVAEVGAPAGTTVEVASLFGNQPARLKFLKGEPTEASHITDAVSRLAMAHPALHVRLSHNGRTVIDVPPDRDGLSRAGALVGARLAQKLHRVSGQENGVSVEAFLAAPELAQSTARGVQLFVGRRAVRDRGLLHAVAMGYGELVARGRYPVAIVLVAMPAGAVDFNVHPQKSEVRFSDATAVATAVRHIVRAGVAGAPWLRESAATATMALKEATTEFSPGRRSATDQPARSENASGFATSLAHRYAASLAPHGAAQLRWNAASPTAAPSRASEGAPRWQAATRAVQHQRSAFDAAGSPGRAPANDPAVAAPLATPPTTHPRGLPADEFDDPSAVNSAESASPKVDPPPISGFFSSLRFIGQLQLTYLVCEVAGEMVLIDQHAAHERVEFERLRERRRQHHGGATQRLLFPATIDVPPGHVALAEEFAAVWAQIGYDVEPFGKSAIAIKSVPAGMRTSDPIAVLRELLDDWMEAGGSRAVESRMQDALATIACHCAVRAGDILSVTEVEALLVAMDQVDFRDHCPHGRPVLLRLSIDEIARRFGR
jgi:DNA mismatch repair protein MutL